MLANIDVGTVQRREVKLANGANAFVASPSAGGSFPVMVVLHERYGLLDHSRDVATRFASNGFVAIAPNLFWREPNQEAIAKAEARAEVPDTQVCEDIGAALDHIAGIPGSRLETTAVMGVCQTGRHPLAFSASPLSTGRLAACVVFHGAAYPREWVMNAEKTVPYDELIAQSRVPVFGAFGENDFLISRDDVLRFRSSLEAAQRPYEIRIYTGAPHSWLNDRIDAYREPQAEMAWAALLDFLKRVRDGSFAQDRVQWRFESETGLATG